MLLLVSTFAYPIFSLSQASYRYIYVFDISQSMNVMDVYNKQVSVSRLNFVKQAAIDSLSKLPCGTELGFALFTGHRALLLTTPIEVCKNQLDLSNTIKLIDWTATWEARSEIAKGLYKSIRLMKRLGNHTAVIFFTDGQEAPPVNPDLLPVFSGKKGAIKGIVVGVGGDKLTPIPKLDRTGKQVGFWKSDEVVHIDVYSQEKNRREGVKLPLGTEHLSSLRESYLKDLADKTGLKYFRLANTDLLLEQLKTKSLGYSKVVQADIRWLFALLALFLFTLLYLILPLRRLMKRTYIGSRGKK